MKNFAPNMELQTKVPVLLYDDECAVCRKIAAWVARSAGEKPGESNLIVRPIGEDALELERLSPGLNIWDAYATIHLVMPDGRLKMGGEAVSEVFRNLPRTRWLAKGFSLQFFGLRPFQKLMDAAYSFLAEIRPLLGCESCGAPRGWVKHLHRTLQWFRKI